MSEFGDVAKRFKAQKAKQTAEQEKPYDHEESYRLRGKMLGILIRDARLNAARTVEDCARLLNVAPEVITSWEYGEAVPNLPQLELLAYYLDVPITHFWGDQTMEVDKEQKKTVQGEYMQLRHRMIGALLRQAREEQDISLEALADASQIPLDTLQAYEVGDVPIPMHHLSVLSGHVHRNMDYFLEASGYIGELLKIREEWKRFTDLDPEIREFAANPLNVAFIKIAITFSKMPAEELRKAGEGLLDIAM